MSLISKYKLRIERRKRLIRAIRKRKELLPVVNQTSQIKKDDILLFCTFRNESIRLPYFLEYYRKQGVNHFLFVDNDSNDGGREYLSEQKDVSIWTTTASYKRSKFGMDWINWLLLRYGHKHWVLVVDPDEFLVYPFCDTRPLRALTDWLDASAIKSFSTMLLDVYPKGPVSRTNYQRGQNPMEIAQWFDSGNYTIKQNYQYHNLWIQGGPRQRIFFADAPQKAPALNKVSLVKWHYRYAYISSTHTLLPRGLNKVYEDGNGEKTCGVLLHAKFLNTLQAKAQEELRRGEHYSGSIEYKAYAEGLKDDVDLWCKWSERYINWRQLEILGLLSKGNWA